MASHTNEIFTSAFNAIELKIDYNPEWANGTGYFDGAAECETAPKLSPGQMVKAVDPTGRRIILIGTRLGNFVLYDRYTNWQKDTVFVYNTTREISRLNYFAGTRLGESDLLLLVGSWGDIEENFGNHLERVAGVFHSKEKGKV